MVAGISNRFTSMSKSQNVYSNIDKEFHEIVNSKELFRQVTEKYLDKIIETITIGIALGIHRNKKAKILDLDKESSTKEDGHRPCVDIFGPYNFKKKYECLCLNCDRIVGASVFAPHLEVCMGMGRSRSRNASRRIANSSRERENQSYGGLPSDDEDDMDWNSGDKRKKKKERNGSKKLKATTKKVNEVDSTESMNVDVEGESDDILNLQDLLQDFARGTSPADSVSSSGSTNNRKKEKSKNKKRKERSSPNSNLNIN